MANGYWGDEWEKLEEGLKRLDPVFEEFARIHGLRLAKNHKSPDRSYEWGVQPRLIIQVYSGAKLPARFTVWVSASDDRSREEYWKHATLCSNVTETELATTLAASLAKAFELAEGWVDKYPG